MSPLFLPDAESDRWRRAGFYIGPGHDFGSKIETEKSGKNTEQSACRVRMAGTSCFPSSATRPSSNGHLSAGRYERFFERCDV